MKVRNQALNATNVLEDLKLSGSGNLRVCLQELGNEGSERLNVDVGSTVSQLPTALTGEGNLKVSIQEDHTHDLATSTNQTLTNSKLDTIATNTANIKISTDSVNLNVDTLETLQTSTNTKLDTLETSLTSMESKMDVDNVVYDNQLTKLTSIEGKVILPAALTGSGNLKVCIQELGNEGSERLNVDVGDDITQLPTALTGSGNLKVSIEEGAISGFSTAANQATIIGHVDGLEGKLDTLETSLTSIEGKIDTLDSVLDNVLTKQSDGLQQVKIKGKFNSSLPTVSDGNFEFLQCDTNGRIEVRTHSDDVGVATTVNTPESTPIPITGVLVHDDSNNAVRSLKCDTSGNLLVSASLSSTDNTVLDNSLTKQGEIETSLNSLISANHTDLVALEASLTSIEGKIDTLDSVQDNALTSLQLIDDIVKAEDSAHSSTDKGVMFLGVRQDTQADFGADGDYVPLSINDEGQLRVTTANGSGMTLTTVDSSLAIGNGATDTSAAIEIKSSGAINILVQSGVLGSSFVLALEASMDGSTFHAFNSSYLTQNSSGNSIQAFIDPSAFRPKFIKLKVTNNDVGSQNFDTFVFQ